MTLKLPIHGLIARQDDYFVKYDADDKAHPYALWRDETWIGSYQRRARAVEEMRYRIELSR